MSTIYSARTVKRRTIGRYIIDEASAQNLDRDVVLLRMLQTKPEQHKDMVGRQRAARKAPTP